MSNEVIITLVGGFLTILGAVSTAIYKLTSRITKTEMKVEVLWDYIMRRAMSEAVNKGIATMNSPIKVVITDEIRSWYTNMQDDLRQFYKSINGDKLSDRELFMMIEDQFGNRILKEICIPHNLHAGSCVIAAIAIARGEDTRIVQIAQDTSKDIMKSASKDIPKITAAVGN